MHLNSELVFKRYAKGLFKPDMRVLEVGPDKYPSTYKRLVNIEKINWETIDLFEHRDLTYVAKDEYNFTIADNTFDIVVSGQVIKHVRRPWIWIKELTRVCKVGGYVITIAPVNWPYHESPIDCFRFYPAGMCALYEEAGLSVKICKCASLDHSLLKVSLRELSFHKEATTFKSLFKRIFTWPFAYSIIDTIAIGVKR